ncbi:MAG: serine/threonine-protein kinase, partial [Paucibacter sp.]|nr:serine/threonine-protein kinase [Roseateles sp.]
MATLISPQARLPIPAAATPAVDAVGVRAQAPVSSAASSAGDSGNALPLGTYLGEFELTSVLGEGGFGIVYLAWDHSLERRVALKEYMPAALSARLGDTQVQVKSERHRDTFEAGLKSFVNEAKLLASFDHPSLVKVYRFWEANGTAYMVMPFYEGVTLKDRLRELGEPPSEAWLMGLLAPLTEALAVIHAQNCFHRDIAPDNVILIGERQKPLLLDFGAA